MRVTNILLVEQHLMPDFAHPAHPPPTNTRTHTNKKGHCLPNDLCPSHLQPTRFFFNSHHDECTSFFITQLPKNKRKHLFHKS